MSKTLNILKLILGILIIAAIALKVGLDNILEQIYRINPLVVIPILIILFVTFIIACLNLYLFLRVLGYRIGIMRLFRCYMISWSVGLLIPGKLGEFAIVPLLKTEGVGLGKGLSVAMLDKLITVFTLGLISIAGLLFIFSVPQTAGITALIVMGIVLPVALIASGHARMFVRKFILRKYERRFTGFSKTFFLLMKSKVTLVNIMLTFLKWAVSATTLWLFFVSIGSSVSIVHIFFINCIATIVSLIPVTIGGAGIRELTAVYMYSAVGVGSSVVMGVYILFLALNYLMGAVTFVFFGFDRKIIGGRVI